MSIKRIKPSKQGDLDGACGFYAIVNALMSLEPELDAEELFTQTFISHLYDGDPMRFINGTKRGSIKNVLSRVIDYLHDHFTFSDGKSGLEYKFCMKMPFWRADKERNRKSMLTVLKQADFKAGVVCIIGYGYADGDGEQDYAHWSVVTKVNDDGLHLLDSGKEKKLISFDSIRVDSKQSSNVARPYNIYSEDIFVISRELT
ncbi:hypothetical protein JAO78_007370 [Alishewanella sp. 16-MA]|uniref:Peptidase C39-like domain-containing protein n=1 Tax=Alishewanella maricola TaxID=2795740 RepID=A0ABS8C3D8_9ALTE|nr:hypothetical protein [Alishewanella maricola]MCB5226635.1 hypothetical protein [Alishewanella maricola]